MRRWRRTALAVLLYAITSIVSRDIRAETANETRRRERFFDEAAAVFRISPATPEIRAQGATELLWSQRQNILSRRLEHEHSERSRLDAITMFARLQDPRAFPILSRVATFDGGYSSRVRSTARWALVSLWPVIPDSERAQLAQFLSDEESAIISHYRSQGVITSDFERSQLDDLRACQEEAARFLHEGYVEGPRPKMRRIFRQELQAEIPYVVRDTVDGIVGMISAAKTPEELKLKMVEGTVYSFVRLIYSAYGIPAGLITKGAYGDNGREIVHDTANALPWVAPMLVRAPTGARAPVRTPATPMELPAVQPELLPAMTLSPAIPEVTGGAPRPPSPSTRLPQTPPKPTQRPGEIRVPPPPGPPKQVFAQVGMEMRSPRSFSGGKVPPSPKEEPSIGNRSMSPASSPTTSSSTPERILPFTPGGQVEAVWTQLDLGYAVERTGTGRLVVREIDLSRGAPLHNYEILMPRGTPRVFDIQTVGNKVYLAANDRGILAVDLKANETVQYDILGGRATAITVEPTVDRLIASNSLGDVSVYNLKSSEYSDFHVPYGPTHRVRAYANKVYVSDGGTALALLELDDVFHLSPKTSQYPNLGCGQVLDFRIFDDRLYVLGKVDARTTGVFVLDVNGKYLRQSHSYALPPLIDARGLDVGKTHITVAAGRDGLIRLPRREASRVVDGEPWVRGGTHLPVVTD